MTARWQRRWPEMPFDAWPVQDQQAWHAATWQGGVLDEGGPASMFAKATLRTMRSVYGGLLRWLEGKGWLDRDAGPADRLTIERFVAYVATRRATASPNTILNNVGMLVMTLSCLAPGQDWSWLRRHQCVPTRDEARSARKVRRPVPVGVLLASIIARLRELSDQVPTTTTAARYRDLLLVALCASSTLRLRNLMQLTLGRSIRRHESCYCILEPSGSLKNRSAAAMIVMPELTPFIDRYLEQHRRILLGGAEAEALHALWITPDARCMSHQAAQRAFERITIEILGWPVNPHSFRHSAVTLMMSADPRSLEVSAALLAHNDPSTTEAYYDLSVDQAAREVWRSITENYRRPPRGSKGRKR